MEQQERPNLILSGFRKIPSNVRTVFFGVLIFGLLSQGMGLFNKFSHHDDVAILFDMGTTVSSGRWTLQIFTWLEGLFYGTGSTSLPLFNGTLSLLLLGAVGGLLVSLLKIRNPVYCFLLGGIMAAFPVITALFAYMFTSHAYMTGLLMMVTSAYLICRKTPWWVKIIAVGIGGAGVGIYQAYLSVFASIILFGNIMELAEGDEDWRSVLKRLAVHLLCIIGVMLVYAAGNRFFLNKYQVVLSGYQGIDEMGKMTVQELLRRFGRAYGEFFQPTRQVFGDMYPGTLHELYLLMLAIEGILILRVLILKWKRNRGQAVLLAVLFAMIPMGCNLVYIMVEEEVHALMTYGQIMQVVLFVWLFDRLDLSALKIRKGLSVLASLVLGVMSVMYVRYDNQCYLKDALHQQEAISFFTTLVTQIKSLPGYRPDMVVFFANAEDPEGDPTVYNIDELDFIRINPYWHDTMEYLHCPTRNTFIKVWCGADLPWGWDPSVETMPEVQAMPSYPADGSVQIINGAVVVKF
ncbi:MAG: glucosyltransferase domain-containing protein [Clostridia bacterium]|nr:glucosyltransferase domain-containing protein [Clostridia bacterium]